MYLSRFVFHTLSKYASCSSFVFFPNKPGNFFLPCNIEMNFPVSFMNRSYLPFIIKPWLMILVSLSQMPQYYYSINALVYYTALCGYHSVNRSDRTAADSEQNVRIYSSASIAFSKPGPVLCVRLSFFKLSLFNFLQNFNDMEVFGSALVRQFVSLYLVSKDHRLLE